MNTLIKRHRISFLLMLFIISLPSCEKEIDVELRSVPPQLVIEGIVKQDQLATVRVTQTLDFSNNNGYPNLSGAIVTISDDQGNSEILRQGSNGWYTAENLRGVIGRTYTMSVVYEGKEYTSVSQMPPRVPLDSVTIKKIKAIDNPFVNLHFAIPSGDANQYYRALLFINGKQNPDLAEYVMSADMINDGLPDFQWSLMVFANDADIDPIKKGDELTLELQCIDKGTHKFFDSLVNAVGTPTNPISNISNGALGYFSACTTDQKIIIADWKD
ncbi:MAG TPA: DUF4249 domain-containing protein [Dysgonomonas sp.]|nr:DUF4249 domain-containing protein [Dysgonomonas sp.]